LDPTIFGYANVQDLVADYPPGSLDVFLRDGQIYGLFSELNTLALFYNKRMFAEAGISDLPADKPVSWEEICQIGQKLRKQDPNTGALAQIGYQFGFFAAFRSPQWYAQNYYALLRQFGQDDLYVDGKPAANTDAAIKAFQVIADLTQKCKAYDPNFLANWFADFPNNRVAMVLAGSWFAPAARKENPNVSIGVAPHPVVNPEDKNSFANIVWSWGWSVNANTDAERQKPAQQFLAFILGKKGDAAMPAYWFEATGYFQPRKAFLESKQYKDLIAADPWLTQFTRAFELFRTDYVQHSYDEAGAALVRAIDRVVYDGRSARDAAEGLQRELSRL
jgi:multiple sugar transport system substrate-binding protein